MLKKDKKVTERKIQVNKYKIRLIRTLFFNRCIISVKIELINFVLLKSEVDDTFESDYV